MDAFKTVVIVVMVIAVAALGFIAVVANDAIEGAKIPDGEYGTVISKEAVTDEHPADYMVTLDNGKTLYIQNKINATLYNSLNENVSYVFNCRIDFKNQMILIESATEKNRTAT